MVAFSCDGLRIIASGKDLDELDRQVLEVGEDPENVLLHRVPVDDMIFSGSEIS